jgi:hypothetical protein
MPQMFGAYHNAEIAKWWSIIKAAGIKRERTHRLSQHCLAALLQ